jgi:hypothetical protein
MEKFHVDFLAPSTADQLQSNVVGKTVEPNSLNKKERHAKSIGV